MSGPAPADYLSLAALLNGKCPTCGKIYDALHKPRCKCAHGQEQG